MRTNTRLWILAIAAIFLASAGCGGGDSGQTEDSGPGPDSNDRTPDAAVDAPRALPTHLLITEVVLGNNSKEFIEIANPTTETIPLKNYFLSDDHEYYKLPGMLGATDAPKLTLPGDFIAKFPDDATLAPGGVATIAFRYDNFIKTSGYDQEPTFTLDYEVAPADTSKIMIDAGAPAGLDFLDDPGDAIDSTDFPNLVNQDDAATTGGEPVVLFYWDGMTDTVQDVDMLHAGNPVKTSNQLDDKDSQDGVDGPDADTDPTKYKPEKSPLGFFIAEAAASGLSHKRIRLEEGFEDQNGDSNGITGDDETTENLSKTWDSPPFSTPTPGQVPTVITGN